jgi:hypothetical protein
MRVFEKRAMRRILGLRGRNYRGLEEVTSRGVSIIFTFAKCYETGKVFWPRHEGI